MYTRFSNTLITVSHAIASGPFSDSVATFSDRSFFFTLPEAVPENTLITVQIENVLNPLFKV